MKTIGITGGFGYVGSVLTRDLLERGYRVTILEKFMFGLDSVKSIINHPNLKIIIGDIRNQEDLKEFLDEDLSAVIHLAAIVGDAACAVDVNLTVTVNYIATLNLLRFCKERKIKRFIFASTCSVYGAADSDMLTEESKTDPNTGYAETKFDAERKMLAAADGAFKPALLRFGTLYGLSPRMRFDLVINFLTQKLYNEKKGFIFGGEQWRPFVHVKDISRAIIVVLESPVEKVAGEIFNVGDTAENFQLKDLKDSFEKIITGCKIEILKGTKDRRSYRVSFDKIKERLGFTAKYSVADGIREIYEELKRGTFKDVKDKKYFNYKTEG